MPSISLKFTTTGEKRAPKKGEWYLDDGWPTLRTYEQTGYAGIDHKILRLVSQKRKGVPLEKEDKFSKTKEEKTFFNPPIAAFAFTGEYRFPKKGEWFVAFETSPPEQADEDYKKNAHRILRRLTKDEAVTLVFTRRNDKNEKKVA